MHVELVDLVRCLGAHEDSWLVAAAHETKQRVIVQGVLGCPICGAEYPIVDGVADFRIDRASDAAGSDATNRGSRSTSVADDSDTFRLAAQLDLGAPGKTIALIGYGMHDARALQQLVPVRIVLVNGPIESLDADGEPVARITCPHVLPIANASLDGIAMRAGHPLPSNAVDVLRASGRMVAPHHVDVPAGTDELARDDREWVAARVAVSSRPVQLSRRQPSE
jgi:uncharacterized protein YbaR (Trm112 family)